MKSVATATFALIDQTRETVSKNSAVSRTRNRLGNLSHIEQYATEQLKSNPFSADISFLPSSNRKILSN